MSSEQERKKAAEKRSQQAEQGRPPGPTTKGQDGRTLVVR